MADIRINQLPLDNAPVASDFVPIDNGTTRKATIQKLVETGRPVASQAEAEAGVDSTKSMSALTTKQAVDFYGLTKAGNLSGLADLPTAQSNLGLGSAAVESAASFATAAQGALANTAVQPARAVNTGTGLTGGGDLSANRTIALNSSSIASLVLADASVQPNASLGVTRTSTAAGEAIDPGHFGGKFLLGKTASKLRVATPGPTDSSDGPRFALSLEHVFPGGTDNTPPGDDDGPDDCRGGLWILSSIDNWLTNTNYGEPNLIYGLVQGGLYSDAGGLLLGGYKVFDDAGGTGSGSLTPIEVSGVRVNSAGTETSRLQSIVALQEVAGGALNKHGAGFWTRNEVDANNQGFVAVNGGAAFKYAFAGYSSQSTSDMYFAAYWNGNSVIDLGKPANKIGVVHDTATGALLLQNTAGTQNLVSLTQTGVLAALAGVTVASGQATLKRVLTNTAVLNFASVPANSEGTPLTMTVTGALVGDSVIINVTSGLFTARLNYFGVVTSTNTVTIYVNNVSTGALDPGDQTFRATVLGF